jgi:diadenosine tetraphosphate (Ap4A) HIT family hydrolase
MDTSVDLDDCPLCAGDRAVRDGSAPPREQVLVTDAWRVIAHRSGLPGWMLVAARGHVRSMADLTPEDAAELGRILQQGTVALADGFGAVKSYVMQFSEGMLGHLHFSLVPRLEDLPEDRRGAAVSAYNAVDAPIGDDARDDVARRLQSAWPRDVT